MGFEFVYWDCKHALALTSTKAMVRSGIVWRMLMKLRGVDVSESDGEGDGDESKARSQRLHQAEIHSYNQKDSQVH